MEHKHYHTTFGEVSENNKAIVISEIERGIDDIISKRSGAVRMLTVIMLDEPEDGSP